MDLLDLSTRPLERKQPGTRVQINHPNGGARILAASSSPPLRHPGSCFSAELNRAADQRPSIPLRVRDGPCPRSEGCDGLDDRAHEADQPGQFRILQGLGQAVGLQGAGRGDGCQGQVDPQGDGSASEELGARVRLAEEAGAQVFLSIHHNAKASVAEGRVSHGTHMYYFHPQSRVLAQTLAAPVAAAIGEPEYASFWRSFQVTRQTGMPAVLVEVNFLSNPALEAQTRQADYAARAAGGILQGLLDFFRRTQGSEAGAWGA